MCQRRKIIIIDNRVWYWWCMLVCHWSSREGEIYTAYISQLITCLQVPGCLHNCSQYSFIITMLLFLKRLWGRGHSWAVGCGILVYGTYLTFVRHVYVPIFLCMILQGKTWGGDESRSDLVRIHAYSYFLLLICYLKHVCKRTALLRPGREPAVWSFDWSVTLSPNEKWQVGRRSHEPVLSTPK